MDEFIKIRIEELKVLRENVLQKQREELAKIDVRIDELKSMLTSSGIAYSSDEKVDLATVSKVASVLNEDKKPVAIKKAEAPEIIEEKKESIMDDFQFEMDVESPKVKTTMNSEEVDLESMLADL
jgi:hypothetical protein